MTCRHLRRAFFRRICSNGAVQVRELCLDCGTNVRGAGINVAHAEAVSATGAPVSMLPEMPVGRGQDTPSLFDGME
jgi:hypothetical protein